MKYCNGLLTAFCLLVSPVFAVAEDRVASTSPAESFAQTKGEWKAINEKLDEIHQRFLAAPQTERGELRDEYSKLVAEARAMLPKLRAAARDAYAAAPNGDEELTNLLVGLMSSDAREGDIQAAYETGKVLADNGCSSPDFGSLFALVAFSADDDAAARKQLEKAKQTGRLTAEEKLLDKELAIREAEAEADDLPRVKLTTTKGEVVIELFENEAPETVGNFISLVEKGVYNGLKFHRVIPGFMAQGGDPKGNGTGGPGYKIYCECRKENHRKHFRGVLSMAHAGPNTGGSQFFITFDRTPHLDGKHTVFGRVIEGQTMVVDKLQATEGPTAGDGAPDKIIKAEVIRKRDHEYKPNKVE
jgi:cyclophilin family peptidyl-prolyl cis-trans isomerase/Skp family chaperone for outer membrane proteins